MGWAQRLDRLIPDLSATLLRFPVPAALSVILFVYMQIALHLHAELDWDVVAAIAAAFFGAGAAHLFAEGRSLSRVTGFALALVAGAILAAAGYFSQAFNTNLLYLFGGLAGLVMVAPFVRRDVEQGAVWLFNLRFGLAALLAIVVAVVFMLGLSGIAETLHLLFGVSTGNIHERIWTTGLSLVGPLYGLSLLPRDLDEPVDVAAQKGSLLERGVAVLVNYVAVPVAVIYAVILHAYAVKITIDGELPKGQIATMVSIFAVGGTATWLVAWPWRDIGTRLLRHFMRYWFFALLVPAVLLVAAIWRRLSDYGMTPDRYGIALVAIWVAALAIYLAIRKNNADMRAIVGAAAALLLVGAAGPWGANGTTISSQFGRLVALLEINGVLKDGKITKPEKQFPTEISSKGASFIYALRDANGLYRLAPWFEGDPTSPFAKGYTRWSLAYDINEKLGFSTSSTSANWVSFNANRPAAIEVAAGGHLFGPFVNMRLYPNSKPQEPMTAMSNDKDVIIRLAGRTYTVNQEELLKQAQTNLAANPNEQQPLHVEIAPGVTMVIDQLSGNLGGTQPLGSVHFWIIQQPQP